MSDVPPADINIRSIAGLNGIPRETVRPRSSLLVAKGGVERDAQGHTGATAKAKVDLAPLTVASPRGLPTMKVTLPDW